MTNSSDENQPTNAQISNELQTLRTQFRITASVASITVIILSGFGFSKLSDIETQARQRIDTAVKNSVEYFDHMTNAQVRANVGSFSSAVGHLEQAYALRPDDEFTFSSLLESYANAANIEAGLKLLESADRSGLLVRKFSGISTQLSAARLYMIAGVKDEKYIQSAQYHFDRAERIAQTQSDGDLSYVLYSAGIFQHLTGNEKKAKAILERLGELDPRTKQWPGGDRPAPWFQQLLKVRPSLQEDLEALFEKSETSNGT